jgi:meso-butanediol dehydrogenase / (S,S)-butanediol dehydrogenase / diacetyl reductase
MAMSAKVAVVTGGSVGLGLSIAQRLRRDGWQIAILGRRPEPLHRAASDGILPYVCDVANDGMVEKTANAIASDLGEVSALVNNAGIIRVGPFLAAEPGQIREQIDVNIMGVFFCTKYFAPALKKARGAIVNISSAIASRPILDSAVYITTKGAVEAFTRAMAMELAPEVRVNVVAPGLVRSDIYVEQGMPSREYQDMLKVYGSKYLLGRHGEPEDVADAVAFLVGGQSSWITGTTLRVDSGFIDVGFGG